MPCNFKNGLVKTLKNTAVIVLPYLPYLPLSYRAYWRMCKYHCVQSLVLVTSLFYLMRVHVTGLRIVTVPAIVATGLLQGMTVTMEIFAGSKAEQKRANILQSGAAIVVRHYCIGGIYLSGHFAFVWKPNL